MAVLRAEPHSFPTCEEAPTASLFCPISQPSPCASVHAGLGHRDQLPILFTNEGTEAFKQKRAQVKAKPPPFSETAGCIYRVPGLGRHCADPKGTCLGALPIKWQGIFNIYRDEGHGVQGHLRMWVRKSHFSRGW